jgi:iron complex outermembrane receptor protein
MITCSSLNFKKSILAAAISAMSLSVSAQSGAPLEVIVVTAQKRAVNLQDSSLSISALSGDTLEENGVFNAEDLAKSITGFSLTGNTFDLELNMRGITNTRLDSPTSDPSVGVFIDEVYVGRMGLMSTDFYDLERIEVIRGPQGVLLGKNVVGGALSIITAKPEYRRSGELLLNAGNYGLRSTSGYINDALNEEWAGRFSFQTRDRGGYAEDITTGRELEDLNSVQARAQLLYEDDDGDFTARLSVEYNKDSMNSINRYAVKQPGKGPFVLGQWSNVHSALGLNERQSAVGTLPYLEGDLLPNLERESFGVILTLEKELEFATLTAITGYRSGEGYHRYAQTGVGYEAVESLSPGLSELIPFTTPVWEDEDISQVSQEVRLTSNNSDSSWEWLVGAYYQKDNTDKFDKFLGITKLAIPSLSGESHWDGSAENTTSAIFGQLGYMFNEKWRLVAGMRYTRDKKGGHVIATAISTGDMFNAPDGVPVTTLQSGAGFEVSYGETWSEFIPQAIVEYTPSDDLLLYLSATKGFKGGGFEDTPGNAIAAGLAFDPEFVTSIELGAKYDLLDGRMRINGAIFDMDYTDLQVAQLNVACLCNITENASDASIRGVELEMQFSATESLLLSLGGSYLDTEYVDFIESSGLDNSGNDLQRTPDSQFNVGLKYFADVGGWNDALIYSLNYTWQNEMFWGPQSTNIEDSYGLLDARLTLAPDDNPWSVSIWVKNATDEVYRNTVIAAFNDELGLYSPPRTFGVDLKWSFY